MNYFFWHATHSCMFLRTEEVLELMRLFWYNFVVYLGEKSSIPHSNFSYCQLMLAVTELTKL
jgi:hypothetical protein